MKKRINYDIEKEMDAVIIYLAQTVLDSGHNEKPVISHSIRVGMTLFNWGYSREVVIAGILHDIIEDTNLTENELRAEFGEKITGIVSSGTFDSRIQSKQAQNYDMFMRCRNYGFDALIVKCADIFDNIDYFIPTPGYEELANYLIEKYHLFLEISEDVLKNEELYCALKDKVFRADQLMDAYIKNLNKTE